MNAISFSSEVGRESANFCLELANKHFSQEAESYFILEHSNNYIFDIFANFPKDTWSSNLISCIIFNSKAELRIEPICYGDTNCSYRLLLDLATKPESDAEPKTWVRDNSYLLRKHKTTEAILKSGRTALIHREYFVEDEDHTLVLSADRLLALK